jgi:hypothetical protein
MTSNFIVQLKACQHVSFYKQKLLKHTKCYTYHISVFNALRYYRAFNKWVLSQGKFNKRKFTFILGEFIPLPSPQIHFQFICIFILKLVNSDNSDHYFYNICKCLSSIIYYDFYMHKVDCFFLFQCTSYSFY